MTRKFFMFLCIFVCLVAGPQWLAEESAAGILPGAAGAVEQESVAAESDFAPKQLPQSFEEILNGPEKVEMAGCSASYNCVHGGSVNCSAPTGTCTSSGQRCGRVTCNGTTTWCAGACQHAFNCANFCYTNYGSTDGDCDSFGCCVCY